MAICLRTFSHKILPINGIVTTKNHSNRLARKIPLRTQFLEDVSYLVTIFLYYNTIYVIYFFIKCPKTVMH